MTDKKKIFKEAEAHFESNDEKLNEKSFAVMKQLADEGYEDADRFVGFMYMTGKGIEKNFEAAFPYLKRAAENGNYVSNYFIAELYYNGIGTEVSRSEAYYNYRFAEDGGIPGADKALKELEFSVEDKEKYESLLSSTEITDKMIDTLSKEENPSPTSKYLLAKHYCEISTPESYGKLGEALSLARAAYFEKLNIAKLLMMEICGKYIGSVMLMLAENINEYEKGQRSEENEPNAVLVSITGGKSKPIYIEDFSSAESLGKPLGCDRVDIISTKGMKYFSFATPQIVVGYTDSCGRVKELINNSVMSTLSGYSYLAGDCVLCGYDEDGYQPLSPALACAIAEFFNKYDVYYDGKMFEVICNFLP